MADKKNHIEYTELDARVSAKLPAAPFAARRGQRLVVEDLSPVMNNVVFDDFSHIRRRKSMKAVKAAHSTPFFNPSFDEIMKASEDSDGTAFVNADGMPFMKSYDRIYRVSGKLNAEVFDEAKKRAMEPPRPVKLIVSPAIYQELQDAGYSIFYPVKLTVNVSTAQNTIDGLKSLVEALEAGGYKAAPSNLVQGTACGPDAIVVGATLEPPCECGALKTGYMQREGHSSWCPYKKV